jgi:hypothetical protein
VSASIEMNTARVLLLARRSNSGARATQGAHQCALNIAITGTFTSRASASKFRSVAVIEPELSFLGIA